MPPRRRLALVLAVLVGLAGLAAMFWRIRRGVDYTDEAFYVGLAVRFALGDRPFVDELNIAQTSGLLLYPFVKLHVVLRGTTGLFLFVRSLFVLFFAGVGAAAYALGVTRLHRHAAVVAGMALVPFVPYALPSLSYNTFGCGALAIGLCLTARGLLIERVDRTRVHRDPLFWGGFALAVSAFAYPTLVVGAVAATLATFLVARSDRVRSALRVALGGGAFVLVVLPVFVAAGPRHVKEALVYSVGSVAVTGVKVPILWDGFLAEHPELGKLAIATAVAMGLARRWPRLTACLLPALPWLAHGATPAGPSASLGYVASLAFLAPLFALALRDGRAGLVIIVGVWMPSVASGAAMAWSSSNGPVAAGLGLFPAAIASVILLALWIQELARSFHASDVRLLLGFAPVVFLYTMVKLMNADDAVYRDASLPQLSALITEGPYKGIRTTPARRASLARISREILARQSGGRALFYYDFPAGYIIAQKRPLVGSVWIFPMEPRTSIDAAQFARTATPGDLVFRTDAGLNPTGNALDRAVTERCDPLGSHEGLAIWRVR